MAPSFLTDRPALRGGAFMNTSTKRSITNTRTATTTATTSMCISRCRWASTATPTDMRRYVMRIRMCRMRITGTRIDGLLVVGRLKVPAGSPSP